MNKTKDYSEIISELFNTDTKTITFQVTDDCNLKCTYCYQINKGHHKMNFETAKKFIDILLDNNENTESYMESDKADAIILEFIGGEPFLEVDLMEQITDYFISQTILRNHKWQYLYRISISSNGTLYFEPKVQAYIKKHFQHLSLNITVDGNKQLHDSCRLFEDGSGSYDIAVAAVKHYTEELGGSMGSKMTLSPENIMHTKQAVINLIDLGYTDINLNCVFEKGWTEEHAFILYSQLKDLALYLFENQLEDKIDISLFKEFIYCPKDKEDDSNWCGGNGKMIALDYKGDIYPCIRYMESSLGEKIPPVIVGNVNDGICVLPEHKECSKCLKSITRSSQSSQECMECPIAEGCSWCQAYNYQESGDFNHRATYICVMHKATSLANAFFWNLKYLINNENKQFKIWLPKEEAIKIIPEQEFDFLKKIEYSIELKERNK